MCGIAGTTDRGVNVSALLDRISHRGPDGRGIEREGDATHGHVRLAIIDTSERSSQPFRYRDGLLSYNGELWNFRRLRDGLEGPWRTEGDTEVLAAGLSQEGLPFLHKTDGMFAFAWTKGGDTFIVRDRIGKLPVYVARTAKGWAWASERKAFGKYGGAALPVPPGHYFDVRRGTFVRWYSLPPRAFDPATLPALVVESVNERLLTSDVPVCVLVSGGLDSSLIAAIAARTRPDIVGYCVYVWPDSPDLAAARVVARHIGIELREVRADVPGDAELSASAFCVETATKSAIEIGTIAMPLARRVAADGFKVALSGEGADELFGGYGPLARRAKNDRTWREARTEYVDKMSRGDLIRANKTFMASGVELRTPLCDTAIVEGVLSLSVVACPPNKGLLRSVAEPYLPASIVRRDKSSFHKAAGLRDHFDRLYPSPVRFYNSLIQSSFGSICHG